MSRARYARGFWGSFSACINILTLIWRYRKLGNLTRKQTKINVCKNDCTCARNILFYLLYVNEIAKNGWFVVKRYPVREAKTWQSAVHKAEKGRHAVRKGVSTSWKWIMVHALSLSGLGFQIKYIVTKVRKTTNYWLKHLFCKTNASLPFYTDLGLPCTLLSCEW